MRHERLLDPIEDGNPCGPDLDEAGDDEFINYTFAAEGRLPEQFFSRSEDKAVDGEKVNLDKEVRQISELLERSKDLRLLCLEARFQCFFGSIAAFADCLEAIAALLETFWDDVHPRPTDGDFTLRRNTLEALDDLPQIIIPLQHLPVIRDKRLGSILMRHYLIGSGAVQPREGESAPPADDILSRLADTENSDAVIAARATFLRAAEALIAIGNTFTQHDDYDQPSFDRLMRFLLQGRDMIERARPDLKSGGDASAPDAVLDQTAAPASGTGTSSGVAIASVASGVVAANAAVASHREAAAALEAIESYFVEREPSAPSLILVHQCRQLIGKPLVQALDALLPDRAESAEISFDTGFGFKIAMPQMRAITDEIAAVLPSFDAAGESSEEGEAAPRTYTAANRADANALLGGVESFFRQAEPSSPIPTLLSKARGWLNRDFAAIVGELVKREDPSA